MSTKYDNITIRHTFTDKEKRELAVDMAAASVKKENLDESFKVLKSDFKGQIDSEDAKIKTTARKLQNGFEMRSVKCQKEFLADSREVVWYHPDLGDVVKRRTMTADELQMDFGFDDAK